MRRPPLPWIVLVASLLLTAGASWMVLDASRSRQQEALVSAAESTQNRVLARLETYVALLRGGVGLFAATDGDVSRADFRQYVQQVELQWRYPGIQGVGFTRTFPASAQDSLVDAMRAEGVPEFRVWPDVSDSIRHSIVYLEPFDRRNQAAIGYDMFTEATRARAMSRARDTGEAALSGKVTLVQEIEGPMQAGFLIYIPVYRGGDVPATVAQRREELMGFVYAPFRADDLLSGIFRVAEHARVAFRIYDGDEPEPDFLLHDSRSSGIEPAPGETYAGSLPVEFAGRTWTMTFAPTASFWKDFRAYSAMAIALVGLIMSFLLFALTRAQVRAAEEVHKSERRLRSVMEALPVGMLIADRSGEVTFANSSIRQIWANGEIKGKIVHNGARRWRPGTDHPIPPAEAALARALRGRSVKGEIVDIEAFDGTRKTILNSAFPIRNRSGKIEMVVAAEVDITEQKRAEAALLEREREFRTMVDSIPQLAWMGDADGNILWFNRRWIEYSGMSMEELQSGAWKTLYDPEHVDCIMATMSRSVSKGQRFEETHALRSRTGEYRFFLSRSLPIRDEGGNVIRWFGTSTDITEQLQAREAEARAIREQVAREAAEIREEEIRRHAMELERSNRELQDFAYVASHDLQEPLRKITTFTDLVLDEHSDQLDDDARTYLQRVQGAAFRMSRLIKDLLTFSRVRTRALPFEDVDLNVVLQDTLLDLEILLEDSGGTVEADELPAIEADPMQMRQLFQNIIGNSLKFRRQDVEPRVRITGSWGQGSDENVAASEVQIEIQDNGIGFDEKYLDRIFSPFQRLHGSGEFEGTGIGLAICRRIVERHNGGITARSIKGEGSTFVIRLPLVQPESAPAVS